MLAWIGVIYAKKLATAVLQISDSGLLREVLK